MSGRDERKETKGEEIRRERIVRFACSYCGGYRWVCYHFYSSSLYYDAEDDIGTGSDVEYNEEARWECIACGAPASDEQEEILMNMEIGS